MASSSGGMTGPFWSVEAQQHYWYDHVHDHLVFQDGRRIRRPDSVPRTMLMPPPIQSEYQSPPVGNSPAYVLSGSTSRQPTTGVVGGRTVPANANISDVTSGFGSLTVGGTANTTTRTNPAPTAPNASGVQSYRQPRSEYVTKDGVKTTLTEIKEGSIVDVFNPSSRVQTKYQTGPIQDITDPTLLRDGRGRGAYRKLLQTGSEGDTEQLFSTFEIRATPRRFFTVGKVFQVLWSEPAGESRTQITGAIPARQPGTARGLFTESVYSKVRRFVVIREAQDYCSALPISTYGAQGVSKTGVTKSEHAIIYTGKVAPEPMAIEEPSRGEQGMRPDPIRVEPDDREDKLDPRSRIDFGKVHTIQHNIKVKSYGKVHDNFMAALIRQFNNCWYASSVPTITPMSTSSPTATSSRTLVEARAPAAAIRESVSSGHRSQLPRGSGSGDSQTGQQAAHRSHPPAARNNDSGGDARIRPGEREIIARLQERQRQQYWDAVDQLVERRGMSREEAMGAINARLAQNRAARAEEDDDDDDDDDDED